MAPPVPFSMRLCRLWRMDPSSETWPSLLTITTSMSCLRPRSDTQTNTYIKTPPCWLSIITTGIYHFLMSQGRITFGMAIEDFITAWLEEGRGLDGPLDVVTMSFYRNRLWGAGVNKCVELWRERRVVLVHFGVWWCVYVWAGRFTHLSWYLWWHGMWSEIAALYVMDTDTESANTYQRQNLAKIAPRKVTQMDTSLTGWLC